jgi:hypothetical protein
MIFFQFFNDQLPLQKLQAYTKLIESPVGDDDALCRVESDVWERGMTFVVGRVFPARVSLVDNAPLW